MEEVKITQFEGKITSLALQTQARQKQREYLKNGNSNKFKQLKKKMKERIKVEASKALEKQIEKAKEKGTHWMKAAKRLSARPGEDVSESFMLPSHISANLTPEQSCKAIATYFSKISKEYTPIEEDQSPQWMEFSIFLYLLTNMHVF